MKKIFFGLSLVLSTACVYAQKTTVATPIKAAATIVATQPIATTVATPSVVGFDKLKHNFGKIKQDIAQSISFSLKNNGSKPLIIEQATAQCGCTTPEYSKAPILKGKTSPIKVTYNAKAAGKFSKTVTVKFLGIAEPSILTIEGEVMKSAEPAKKNK